MDSCLCFKWRQRPIVSPVALALRVRRGRTVMHFMSDCTLPAGFASLPVWSNLYGYKLQRGWLKKTFIFNNASILKWICYLSVVIRVIFPHSDESCMLACFKISARPQLEARSDFTWQGFHMATAHTRCKFGAASGVVWETHIRVAAVDSFMTIGYSHSLCCASDCTFVAHCIYTTQGNILHVRHTYLFCMYNV